MTALIAVAALWLAIAIPVAVVIGRVMDRRECPLCGDES